MKSISILLFLFLILTISVYSQRVQYKIPIKLNSSNTSQSYLDGCKAILQGGHSIFGDQGMYYNTFAIWENQFPDQSLLSYFENQKGIISKIWRDNPNSNSWSFNLTLYDGDHVDQKFVNARFDLNDIDSSMNILQSNGTFVSSQQIGVSISYGKSNMVQKEAIIKGQLTIYFLDKKYAPISDFSSQSNANLKEDTLQIIFDSDDGSFSFSTSLFSNIYHIALLDVILVLGFVLAYAFFSLSSIGKVEEFRKKVSLLSVCMVYMSSAYIGLWTIFHFKLTRNFLLFVPLIGVFIDWIKQTIFLLKKKSFSPWGFFFLLSSPPPILAALSNRFVWINLFPALALQVPLLAQLAADTRGERTYYFTKFQVCNWICASMWMGYFYLYPSNIYLTSPQPLLILVSFGLILVQVVISYRMEKEEREIQGRRRGCGNLLLQQPNNQSRSNQRPLIQPSNNQNNIRENDPIELLLDNNELIRDYERILQLDYQFLLDAQRRNREIQSLPNESDISINLLQANQHISREPSRNAFEYTFDAQREEDEAFLTDTCAICCEFLIGDYLDKLYKTPCGHVFHGGCLRAWGQKKLECPCCRKELPQFKNLMS